MGPDVAGSTGDQNGLHVLISHLFHYFSKFPAHAQLSEFSRLAGDLRIDLPLTLQACSQAAGIIEDRA